MKKRSASIEVAGKKTQPLVQPGIAVAQHLSLRNSGEENTSTLVDNRPESIKTRTIQKLMNGKANCTGNMTNDNSKNTTAQSLPVKQRKESGTNSKKHRNPPRGSTVQRASTLSERFSERRKFRNTRHKTSFNTHKLNKTKVYYDSESGKIVRMIPGSYKKLGLKTPEGNSMDTNGPVGIHKKNLKMSEFDRLRIARLKRKIRRFRNNQVWTADNIQLVPVDYDEEGDEICAVMPLFLSRQPGMKPGPGYVNGDFLDRYHSANGMGETMDGNVRSFMENSLGSDFSQARIHTGTAAVQLSKSFGARAFTVGNDIFFGSGQYRPNSQEGQGLLAHELTHVVQQRHKDSRMMYASEAIRSTENPEEEREAKNVEESIQSRSTVSSPKVPQNYSKPVQLHPGYVGAHPLNVLGAANGKIGAVPPHNNVIAPASPPAAAANFIDTITFPPAGALGGGAAHFHAQGFPAAGTVIHRVQANQIRNPGITNTFRNLPAVKAWIAAYAGATGYKGNWNMHHWWPLAWHGDDTHANLTPLPTAAHACGHQTHNQWHHLMLTGGGKQYPKKIGYHFQRM